jgi:aminoglycoside 2''-phosphotransferase
VYYLDFYQRIRQKLFPLMRPDAQRWAARHFEPYLEIESHFTFQPVLRHGDFGTSNLLFDAAGGSLTGVIDFSGAALGDPAVDFAGLLVSYGEDFIHRCQRVYPALGGMLDRARFYAGTFALEEALFGYENGDEAALRAGLEDYV